MKDDREKLTSNHNGSNRYQEVIITDSIVHDKISDIPTNLHYGLVFLRGVNLPNHLEKLSELDCDYLCLDECKGLEHSEAQLANACPKVKKIVFYGRKRNFRINDTKVFFCRNRIKLTKDNNFSSIASNHQSVCDDIKKMLLGYQTKVFPLTDEQKRNKSFQPMEVMSGQVLLFFDNETLDDLRNVIRKSPSVYYVLFKNKSLDLSKEHATLLLELFPNLNYVKNIQDNK
jgi:hypothetical protein